MSWQSTVPAAISAAVAAFQAAASLNGVRVLDGPEISDIAALEVLTIGWADDTTGNAADNQPALEGLAGNPDRELYSIHCAAAVTNGSQDITAARTQAYGILGAAGQVIKADMTLGGVVMNARIGATSLRQVQDTRGATAMVLFDIDCDAYTVR